ncbi:deleted in malignant brain tumors 1 protein-like [Saccostrea cucullata]|uniref:deleted in malignant brain tumors 1 protein-like n=1 Tax=Saccostrea cuccullata TaxID=36930 RepID=UPI002ED660B5
MSHPICIRLVGGSYTGEGRVEVKYHDAWGTVCDDGIIDTNAKSCLSRVGMWHGAIQKQSAPFGQGTGSIVLDDVSCTGTEKSIASCQHNGFTITNCNHSEDVGVVCFSVRLIGESTSNGTVIVKLGNTEGSVCDDNWDNDDASVVCGMLGYNGTTAQTVSNARFGEFSGQMWMDGVNCGDSESALAKCTFNGFGKNDCSHSEDAGVICYCSNLPYRVY